MLNSSKHLNNTKDDPDYYRKLTQKLKQSDYSVDIQTIDFNVPSSSMVKWHWHDEIELIYITAGEAYITCDRSNMLVSAGDIIFINHQIRHFITPVEKSGCRLQCILVNPLFLVGFGHLDLEKKYVTPVIHNANYKYLHINSAHEYHSIYTAQINNILLQNTKKESCFELLTQASLLTLWKYIFDEFTIQNEDPDNNANHPKVTLQDEQRVKQAMLYIQEHFYEPITLDDIAGSILVSKSECCRCFKRAMNMTPFEYLMKYRIIESTKHMHRKNHESISDIACAVGFNNTSYFNKIFKKYMDCTPTEYRSSIKKDLPTL